MPIYHYVCPKCKYEESQFEKIKDRNKHYCPKCDTLMNRKYDLNPAIIYNSPDFYHTTYDRLEEDEPNAKKR